MIIGDLEELQKLWEKREPLHDELKPYVQQVGGKGLYMLNHPLVQIAPFNEEIEAARANWYLEEKKRIRAEYLFKNNYHGYVFVHERPYRVQALVVLLNMKGDLIKDREYWELVASAWTDSENIWQNRQDWQRLWRVKRPCRLYVMDDDERAFFASLPMNMTVYRGVHGKTKRTLRGMSWTLSWEKAEWFAKRYKREEPLILTAHVKKENVLAYFGGRNEREIVTEKAVVKSKLPVT